MLSSLSSLSISTISASSTSSLISVVASLIPRTPVAVRPIARTAFSSKRTTRPCAENNIISLSPLVISTPISSSPSRSVSAIRPFARTLLNASNATFFTTPLAVAIKTNLSAENSPFGIGKIAVIRSFSSFTSGKIFTIGVPRAPRLACGN